MNASLVERNPIDEQVQSPLAVVDELRLEVRELRLENAELCRQVSELRCDVGYWKSCFKRSEQRNATLKAELEQSQAEIRQLKAERFGKRSEKQSAADRSNDLEDPQDQAKPKQKRGQQPNKPAPKRRDHSHLPAREELIDLPEDAKVCDCCGKPRADLGSSDPVEQLEYKTFVYRRVVRRKRYRQTCDCTGSQQTVTAPLPPKVLPKSIYGTSLWVYLLLEKFLLQRPTHRTIEQLKLLGLDLAPGTIAGGLQRIEPLFTPVYDAIREHHLQSAYFHADETRWKMFVERAGKTGHLWWLWLFAGEDTVVYVLDPSRSHDVPQSHFPDDACGVLMVDRYIAYKIIPQVTEGDLLLAFCWAHVRRDFVRVGKGYPELTPWALTWLRLIRDLYRLNRERHQHASGTPEFATADAAVRQQISAMATQREIELADETLRAPCRKVLCSLRDHWNGLTLFLDDPRIPLDNNYGERLMRNPAVGRKNYYGSGAEWSGRLAVMLFSIFATLAKWNINPRNWLNLYLETCAADGGQPPDDPAEFLPWNLSETRLAELQKPTQSENFANTS